MHDSVESQKIELERETDALILARRQKQIDFGKNTIGYEKYLEQVPKHKRKTMHPKTPPKNLKYTRRAWDGLVKNWRVRLHCWDPDFNIDDETIKKDKLYAKGRLTSDFSPIITDPITHEQFNKVIKKSDEHKSIHDSIKSPKIKLECETDALILARRQKQIDFGKNTIGYEKYLEQVPKHERKTMHPKTPPKNLKYTRRTWDGLVKNWRVRLHCWDPDFNYDVHDALTTDSSSNLCSLGSMTSLDSNSQASDSRPSTPPSTKRSSEDSSKRQNNEANSSPDPIKFKKSKTENK